MRLSGCKCARAGRDGLDNSQIFRIPELRSAGGLNALKFLGKPDAILR